MSDATGGLPFAAWIDGEPATAAIATTMQQRDEYAFKIGQVAAERDALTEELAALRHAIAALRELHQPDAAWCAHDGHYWPCPTAKALPPEGPAT